MKFNFKLALPFVAVAALSANTADASAFEEFAINQVKSGKITDPVLARKTLAEAGVKIIDEELEEKLEELGIAAGVADALGDAAAAEGLDEDIQPAVLYEALLAPLEDLADHEDIALIDSATAVCNAAQGLYALANGAREAGAELGADDLVEFSNVVLRVVEHTRNLDDADGETLDAIVAAADQTIEKPDLDSLNALILHLQAFSVAAHQALERAVQDANGE